MPVVELAIDRNLLCANFDGYKLSFDAVPVLRHAFEKDPLHLMPHANQYSLLHTELFAKQNLLFSDPWSRHNCYYMNKAHQLMLICYDEQRGQLREERVVYEVERSDHGDGYGHLVGDYNYSLKFISEKYCVLCDGILTYHLLDTGNRERTTTWQLITRTPVLTNIDPDPDQQQDQRGFLLYDARLDIVQGCKQISLIAGHVGRRRDAHLMQLTWSHWILEQEDATWKYEVVIKLETKGSIYYCAFEPRAQSLIICSNGELQTEEEMEVEAGGGAAGGAAAEVNVPLQNGHDVEQESNYSWTQTDEHVTLKFPFTNQVSRDDFKISCIQQHLKIDYREETLLDDTLYAAVDTDLNLNNWTVASNQLQLTLTKLKQSEHWPRLLDPESDLQPERLPIPNLEDPVEECDFPLGTSTEDIKMVRFNLTTSSITHTIFLGSTPPLFASTIRAGFPAAFATRQGIDGAVWLQQFQPSRPNEWSVRHEGTLHAFGYVQASKEQRKFVDCCPDLDYAVICESYRHVFIYKPRNDSAGGLRNRNGPQVIVGKQNLVTLDSDLGEVLGLVTAPNVIILLTEHAVLHLQV